MQFMDIFGINHKNLRTTDILEFDIDTRDSPPIYIKFHPLPYKYKGFVKTELDLLMKASIMTRLDM